MEKKAFRDGDRVVLTETILSAGLEKGAEGTVREGFYKMDGYTNVRFDDTPCDLMVDSAYLEKPADRTPRHIVFKITDDGGEAKYVRGKETVRTATVRRSPKDGPNDFSAMMYLIGKLFPECGLKVTGIDSDNASRAADKADGLPGFLHVRDGDEEVYISAQSIDHFITEYDECGSENVRVVMSSGGEFVYPCTVKEFAGFVREALDA